MNDEKLKEILLANFGDGDQWEDFRAVSFTREGALDIARFFYELANPQDT